MRADPILIVIDMVSHDAEETEIARERDEREDPGDGCHEGAGEGADETRAEGEEEGDEG